MEVQQGALYPRLLSPRMPRPHCLHHIDPQMLCAHRRISDSPFILLTPLPDLQVMGMRPDTAAGQVNIWEGTCYLTSLIGAWVSDSMLGRYKTILIFSSIYCLVRMAPGQEGVQTGGQGLMIPALLQQGG